MRLASTLLVFATSYASLSAAQDSSTTDVIMTIQPITSILPSSVVSSLSEASRTSTRLGGSQIEPSSFSTSRLTISDASTDRPTQTTSRTSGTLTATPSVTAPTISLPSSAASATSAAATATPSNAATGLSGSPIILMGALAVLGGAILI